MEKNILLVDSDEELLSAHKEALEADGFNIISATSTKDALDKLNELKPDLILTEIMLEYKDAGFSLCYHAKKKYPDVPVIILSDVVRKTGITFNLGSKEEKDWIKADEFIHKPVNKNSLVCRIKRLIKNKETASTLTN
ncbi:MAG: hypothetical protein A2287_09120 [Candidatus Melainabacteria bacterium RIFOXYA12_FULL_32_12]|nr:MAG: hypothetical protein A2255_09415 [Candidatus Melainabacteria bacterium RIFOXYA2_FULL_32_9]OGI27695.1 MAG: hypothetical protein A2287_09120 [Candidatus Melainabacteria bacterium RIFOXYA12_FULL_32_12]